MKHLQYFTRIIMPLYCIAGLFTACIKEPEVPPVKGKWLLSKMYNETPTLSKYLAHEYKYRNGEKTPWLHIAYTAGADSSALDTFFYDNQHRLSQVHRVSFFFNQREEYLSKEIVYDPVGRINSVESTEGYKLTYSYQDTIITILMERSGGFHDTSRYIYNTHGNLVKRQWRHLTEETYAYYDNRPNVLCFLNMNINPSLQEDRDPPLISKNNYGMREVQTIREGSLVVLLYDYRLDSNGLIKEIMETSPTQPFQKQTLEYIPAE